MKKLLLSFLVVSAFNAYAQEDPTQIQSQIDDLKNQQTSIEDQIKQLESQLPVPVPPTWDFKGNLSINFGETVLGDWAAGGSSNLSLSILGHGEANFLKNKHSWNNSFDGNIGFIKNFDAVNKTSSPTVKNADLWQLNSVYMYEISKKMQVGVNANLLSQFYNTKSITNVDSLISSIFAPATLDITPGLQWKPVSYFTLFFSPASARFTFVANKTIRYRIATAAANGQELNPYGNQVGKAVRSEFGARVVATFEKELFKNFTLRSKLQLFNNYTRPQDQLDAIYSKRYNVDVNWQTDIFYQLTKSIAINFGFQTIKDDDIRFSNTDNPDPDGFKSKWQIRQNLGIGIVYGL